MTRKKQKVVEETSTPTVENSDAAELELAKRPTNAWLFYYQHRCHELREAKDNEISKITDKVMNVIRAEWEALTMEEKAPFKVMGEASSMIYATKKDAAKKVEVGTSTSKVTTIATRCSPEKVFNLIDYLKGTPQKVDAINDVGFGWLLNLKPIKLKRALCAYLVDQFNPSTLTLTINGQRATLTPLDVEYILGVEAKGLDIDMVSDPTEVDKLYTNLFGKKEGQTLTQLDDDLRKYETVDDGFKVRFVMFVLGTLLCPNSSTTPRRNLISFVRDVGTISKINWAKVTLHCLASSIKEFRDPSKKVGSTSAIGGCLLFLKLYYFERFCFGHDTVPICERPQPRLHHWGTTEITERHNLLIKKGGYGNSELVLVVDGQLPSASIDMATVTQLIAEQNKKIEDQRNLLMSLITECGEYHKTMLGIPNFRAAIVTYFKQEMAKEVRAVVKEEVKEQLQNLIAEGRIPHSVRLGNQVDKEKGKATVHEVVEDDDSDDQFDEEKGKAIVQNIVEDDDSDDEFEKLLSKGLDGLMQSVGGIHGSDGGNDNGAGQTTFKRIDHLALCDEDDGKTIADQILAKDDNYGLDGPNRPYRMMSTIFGVSPSKGASPITLGSPSKIGTPLTLGTPSKIGAYVTLGTPSKRSTPCKVASPNKPPTVETLHPIKEEEVVREVAKVPVSKKPSKKPKKVAMTTRAPCKVASPNKPLTVETLHAIEDEEVVREVAKVSVSKKPSKQLKKAAMTTRRSSERMPSKVLVSPYVAIEDSRSLRNRAIKTAATTPLQQEEKKQLPKKRKGSTMVPN